MIWIGYVCVDFDLIRIDHLRYGKAQSWHHPSDKN